MTDVCLASSKRMDTNRIPLKESTFAMTKESEDKKEQRAREGAKAWADYEAERRALGEKTARLRALRLARDAATKTLRTVKKKKK